MTKIKAKRGRPELPPGERATERLGLKFRSDEMADVQRAAAADGFAGSAGAWARRQLIALAKKRNARAVA